MKESVSRPEKNGEDGPLLDHSPTTRMGPSLAKITLLGIGFLYGTMDVSMKLLLSPPSVSPTSAVLVKTVLGTLAFVPSLMHRRSKEVPIAAALTLAWWNVAAGLLMYEGFQRTSVSRGAFLLQLSVIATPVLERILLKRSQPRRIWIGASLALIGVAFLAAPTPSDKSSQMGDALVVMSALVWGLYLVRTAGLPPTADPQMVQAVKYVVSLVLYIVWALLLHEAGDETSLLQGWGEWRSWALAIYSALIPGALADVLQQIAQSEVRASEASLLLASEPLWATLLAAPVGQDFGLGLSVALGGAAIFLAIAISSGSLPFGFFRSGESPPPPPLDTTTTVTS